MRASREEKGKSRKRIIASASKLARENGVDRTSVADVMQAAGLTQGGFYRHFEDKDQLIEAAIDSVFEQIVSGLENRIEKVALSEAVAEYIGKYLSDSHMRRPGIGCPVPALGADVARGSNSQKEAFGRGIVRVVEKLAMAAPSSAKSPREWALSRFAMLAGAIVIARASDPETARVMLGACRKEFNVAA